MNKKYFYFFYLIVAVLGLSGCSNYLQQPSNQNTSLVNSPIENSNTSHCEADKHCQIIYTKATENELCEPCPPDYSSTDYICGTIEDYNQYIHESDFNVSCEMCGNEPWEEVECKCVENRCKKFIIKK